MNDERTDIAADGEDDYLTAGNSLKRQDGGENAGAPSSFEGKADGRSAADGSGEGADDGAEVHADGKKAGESDAKISADSQPTSDGKPQGGDKLYFFIALGAFAVGLVLFILSFAVGESGTTLLFISMLAELAGVSFLNAQKRRGEFTACKVLRYACYAVMIIAIAIVIIGISLMTGGAGK